MRSPVSRLWILTGSIGVGKTAICQRLVAEAQGRGWDVAGIFSPGVYQGGQKVAIDAVDVRSNERRRLAWRVTGENSAVIHTQEWRFDPETLCWGNTVFETAVPCDFLVVDEIGPLELERKQGWITALSAIASRAYRLGVVVLRPSLLALAVRWSPAHVLAIRHPDQPLTLADLLGGEPLGVR
ncbi:nucleoside-triphosphatase [Thermanaerothrix sp.]|jgi:nucleoside-triphosphatase THEP1|uniref:nucleoside-triphosphatase n=1 Tax=Thermanaerothrix sp. TaxID=2972675 RepID=UPI002ADDF80A|nr:nucleoside-triphosphatase [Thermanaerothrix sp.]